VDRVATCLVTGGAGFIGSHLVERLAARGHAVRVPDDLRTGRAENLRAVDGRIELLRGTVTDPAAARGVDWVFHLAALPSVRRSVEEPAATHEACATGTLHALEAARPGGARRLVYAASSSSAYGGLPGAARREDDPVAPLSPYAAAELAGEYCCQSFTAAFGLETVCLRFFNVYGPRQRADSPYCGVIPLFITALLHGRRPTVRGDGLQPRDFTYVGDAVEALERAAAAPDAAGRVYNVGGGREVAVLEVLGLLNGILGTKVTPPHGPARPGEVRHSRADLARARRDLGYEPGVPLAEGLRRTVEAFRTPGGASPGQ
jgi:UDP-glucose 4-epimerase